ncbi:MAG: glycosyltransferase family 2 protein [Caldilineaceae bacterium]
MIDTLVAQPAPLNATVPATESAMTHASAPPDLAIVLVCWNNRDYLFPCLASLYGSALRHSFEVVVVDNGSTDGSQAILRREYPEILLIQNDGNVGLGRASNQGIEATRGRHILLLNNDTIVNGPSLDAMVDYLDANPRTAAVGGKLLNPDGTVQSCYNNFSTLHEEFLIARGWANYSGTAIPRMDDDHVRRVAWLGSACLMLRRAAVDEIGLLDESYFIYGDEADFQYRLAQAGWDVVYLPHATTVHFGGRSMNRWGGARWSCGKMLFYRKNYGPVRTTALRTVLGGLSMAKLGLWARPPSRRNTGSRRAKSSSPTWMWSSCA